MSMIFSSYLILWAAEMIIVAFLRPMWTQIRQRVTCCLIWVHTVRWLSEFSEHKSIKKKNKKNTTPQFHIWASSWENGILYICRQQLKLQVRLRKFRTVTLEALLFAFTCNRPEKNLRQTVSFWRYCADVQSHLKLCCLHMSKGPFVTTWLILKLRISTSGCCFNSNEDLMRIDRERIYINSLVIW